MSYLFFNFLEFLNESSMYFLSLHHLFFINFFHLIKHMLQSNCNSSLSEWKIHDTLFLLVSHAS